MLLVPGSFDGLLYMSFGGFRLFCYQFLLLHSAFNRPYTNLIASLAEPQVNSFPFVPTEPSLGRPGRGTGAPPIVRVPTHILLHRLLRLESNQTLMFQGEQEHIALNHS